MKYLLTILMAAITSNVFSQLYPFDSIPDNLKNRASAVVRTEQCLFTIKGPGNAVMKIKKAVTLLNENATAYRLLQIMYDKYSKVSGIRGMIYDQKGNIAEALGPSDVFDMSAISGGTFYSDDRVKLLYFPIYKYPYTIEYEYEITFSSLLNYPSWNFQDAPDVSVQKSGIQYVVPSGMKLRYYNEYLKNPVDSVILDGKKIYTWQEENIPAYESRDVSIRPVYDIPSVNAAPLDFEYAGFRGSMRSWKEFGNWVYEINRDRDELPQSEIDNVRKLVSEEPGTREKVKRIYEYMQLKTRYVSIQIGIGGYRTAEASAVARNGFGDCKALVNYTYSLLKAAGIKSFYTLVRQSSVSDINKDFVNNQFNHAILCVPQAEDTIWLECTSQTYPFNYLSSSTSNKNALLITPEGGIMAKTPSFKKEQNLIRREGNFSISTQGVSSGRMTSIYSGHHYESATFRYAMQSEDEIKRSLYSGMRFNDLDISGVKYSERKTENPSAELECQLAIKNFSTSDAARIYFSPVISVQDYFQEKPVHLKVVLASVSCDSIAYNVPQNYVIEYMPPDIDIENEFGRFVCKFKQEHEVLIFRRIFELNESDITAEKYNSFRAFINTIAKADREKIVLVRTGG